MARSVRQHQSAVAGQVKLDVFTREALGCGSDILELRG